MKQDLKSFHIVVLEPMDSYGNATEVLRKRGATFSYEPHVSRADMRLTEVQVIDFCKNADAILTMTRDPFTADILGVCPKLRIISEFGRGIDHLPLDAAAERGIIIANTPITHSATVAEFTFMLTLMILRDFVKYQTDLIGQGKWRDPSMGRYELSGKTVGLIGLGSIGKQVALRFANLEVAVISCDPNVSKSEMAEVGVVKVVQDTLLQKSDIISLHASLLPASYHLLGEKEFAKMKQGVYIVNTARGGLIDTSAMIRALESGKIAAAGINTFESYPLEMTHPLRGFQNVVCTPHEGATTRESNSRIAAEAVENVVVALLGRVPETVVNPAGITKWRERFCHQDKN